MVRDALEEISSIVHNRKIWGLMTRGKIYRTLMKVSENIQIDLEWLFLT